MERNDRMGGWRWVIAVLALLAHAVAPAGAPVVVETTPTLRARHVDPMLAEIAVRFDQPIRQGSWSFCGGGEAYPPLAGVPRNTAPDTVVLPVRLRPQMTYSLSINCPSATGFRSLSGQPAAPLPFTFTTGSGEAFIPADSTNHESWTEFRRLFRERYSHYGRTGIDWEARLDDAAPWVMEAPTPPEWLRRVSSLLADADDAHLYFRDADNRRHRTHLTFPTYNGNEAAIRSAFPDLVEHNPLVWSARRGDVGYIAIHSWDNDEGRMDAIDPAMETLRTCSTIIVDVRGNGGGDETQAKRLAGWFLESAGVYARHRFRDPDYPSGWTEVRQRVVHPNPPERRFPGRVLVLQGPVCLSSNEAFLLMMRQAARATSLGAPSGGSSGNPGRYPLANGYSLVMARWQSLTPEGESFEGIGLPPDVPVDGDFLNGDPVLARALEMAAGG